MLSLNHILYLLFITMFLLITVNGLFLVKYLVLFFVMFVQSCFIKMHECSIVNTVWIIYCLQYLFGQFF